jgi:hypothetical protein
MVTFRVSAVPIYSEVIAGAEGRSPYDDKFSVATLCTT